MKVRGKRDLRHVLDARCGPHSVANPKHQRPLADADPVARWTCRRFFVPNRGQLDPRVRFSGRTRLPRPCTASRVWRTWFVSF